MSPLRWKYEGNKRFTPQEKEMEMPVLQQDPLHRFERKTQKKSLKKSGESPYSREPRDLLSELTQKSIDKARYLTIFF